MTAPGPGDLVFYGRSTIRTRHVGIYVGGGRMIHAYRTGTIIRTDPVSLVPGRLGYYRL